MSKKQVKSKSKVTKVKFETPEVELRFKSEKGTQTQIPKEEWDKYMSMPIYDKEEENQTVRICQGDNRYELKIKNGKILKTAQTFNKDIKNRKRLNQNVNITYSIEKTKTAKPDLDKEIDSFFYKNRISKFSKQFPKWRFDFTEAVSVRETLKANKILNKVEKETPFYQFEIEWIGKGQPTEKEIDDVINEFRPNIKKMIKEETNINFGALAQPKALEMRNLPKVFKNYAVTEKADGERFALYINKDGDVYRFGRGFSKPEKISTGSKHLKTLLDSELVNDQYNLFDIMIFEGKDLTQKTLQERFKYLKKIKEFPIKKFYFPSNTNKIGKLAKKSYTNKYNYELDGLIYTPINKVYIEQPYKWKPKELCTIDFLIKHKEHKGSKLTLELYISMSRNQMKRYRVRFYPELFKTFKITKKNKYFPYPFIPFGNQKVHTTTVKVDKDFNYKLGKIKIPLNDETIVEFQYNFSNNNEDMPWKPLRFRNDKQEQYEKARKRGEYRGMNGMRAAMGAWNCIQQPITTELLFANEPPQVYFTGKTNKSKQMARFHHSLKKNYYDKYIKKGDDVLELAAGRGGDYWKLSQANYVLFVDIAKNALIEIQSRAEQDHKLKYKKNFLEANVSKNITKEIKDKMNNADIKEFDVVNIQFAFHYFFKTATTLKNAFKNLDTYLKKGGYFMASFFSGERIDKLFKNKNEVVIFKNNSEIFKLTKHYKKRKSTGSRITVKTEILEHDEYVIDLDHLEKFMKKNKYKLVEKISFEEFYNKQNKFKLSNEEKAFSFLNVYVVFQKE